MRDYNHRIRRSLRLCKEQDSNCADVTIRGFQWCGRSKYGIVKHRQQIPCSVQNEPDEFGQESMGKILQNSSKIFITCLQTATNCLEPPVYQIGGLGKDLGGHNNTTVNTKWRQFQPLVYISVALTHTNEHITCSCAISSGNGLNRLVPYFKPFKRGLIIQLTQQDGLHSEPETQSRRLAPRGRRARPPGPLRPRVPGHCERECDRGQPEGTRVPQLQEADQPATGEGQRQPPHRQEGLLAADQGLSPAQPIILICFLSRLFILLRRVTRPAELAVVPSDEERGKRFQCSGLALSHQYTLEPKACLSDSAISCGSSAAQSSLSSQQGDIIIASLCAGYLLAAQLILMLRSLAGPALRQFTFSSGGAVPGHVQLLGRHLTKPGSPNQKLAYLEQLLANNQLGDYFAAKPVKEFTSEDIYFYLKNRDLFGHTGSLELVNVIIHNPALDVLTCFAALDEMHSLDDPDHQRLLTLGFNESCLALTPPELAYCVGLMRQFEPHILQGLLDLNLIRTRLAAPEELGDVLLELLAYLGDLGPAFGEVDKKKLKPVVGKIIDAKMNGTCNLRDAYFAYVISRMFDIGINEAKVIFKIQALKHKVKFTTNQPQHQFAIKLSRINSRFLQHIPTESLASSQYLLYLNTLEYLLATEPSLPWSQHPVPHLAVQNSTPEQFAQILESRIYLQMEQLADLGRSVKNYFTHSLSAVIGLLKYLVSLEEVPHVVHAEFEQGFLSETGLSSKKRDLDRIIKEYDVIKIFELLSLMSSKNLGSIVFWKHSLHFIHDFLIKETYLQKIESEHHSSFLSNCFMIYRYRTMPDYIEQTLVTLTLICLSKSNWSLKKYYDLVKTLSKCKFGNDELWYALEKKIMSVAIHEGSPEKQRYQMAFIYSYFKKMKYCSHQLTRRMTRLEQKKVLPTERELQNHIQKMADRWKKDKEERARRRQRRQENKQKLEKQKKDKDRLSSEQEKQNKSYITELAEDEEPMPTQQKTDKL